MNVTITQLLGRDQMAPVCMLALAETCMMEVESAAKPGSRGQTRAADILYKIQQLNAYHHGKFPPAWYPAVDAAFQRLEEILAELCAAINSTPTDEESHNGKSAA